MLGTLRDRVPLGAVDVVVAVFLATLSMLELALWWRGPMEVEPWSYLLALLMTLPLVHRRRSPEKVMAVVGGAGILAPVLATAMPNGATFGILVALYSVAAHGSQRDAVVSGVITMAVLVYVAVRFWEFVGIAGAAANYLIFGTAWAVGWAARNRRLLLRELETRAVRAERSREAEARRAVAEERARIARELHDVVAHAVSVMVVQAGAARRQVGDGHDGVRDALTAVESTGRRALDELRRLLGVLRTDAPNSGAVLAPQPTLRGLGQLVETMREAGLDAVLTVDGSLDELPAGVDVSAYRVVQEALTNVLKHAGASPRVEVVVRRSDGAVTVEVRDDGRGAASEAPRDGSGQGLVGMRERVALYGGELRAGPQRGGGYRVHASFPFGSGAETRVGRP